MKVTDKKAVSKVVTNLKEMKQSVDKALKDIEKFDSFIPDNLRDKIVLVDENITVIYDLLEDF